MLRGPLGCDQIRGLLTISKQPGCSDYHAGPIFGPHMPIPKHLRKEPAASESVCPNPNWQVCSNRISLINCRLAPIRCAAYDVWFHKSNAQADAVAPCVSYRCGFQRPDCDRK